MDAIDSRNSTIWKQRIKYSKNMLKKVMSYKTIT